MWRDQPLIILSFFLISGRVKNLPRVKIAFVVFTYVTFSHTSKPLSSF